VRSKARERPACKREHHASPTAANKQRALQERTAGRPAVRGFAPPAGVANQKTITAGRPAVRSFARRQACEPENNPRRRQASRAEN
jgi:hypothetical protein